MQTTHEQMMSRLRKLQVRYDAAVAKVSDLEAERADLYAEARTLDPPITFKAIADVFSITEAAVMQKIRRAREKAEAG